MKHLLVAILLFYAGGATAQATRLDSLKNQLRLHVDAASQVALKTHLAIEYYGQSEFEQAEAIFKEVAVMAGEIGDKEAATKAYNNLGNIYCDKGNNPAALGSYQKALAIATSTNNNKYAAHIEKNIGALLVSWKRFDEAITHYDKAEQEAIQLQDSSLLADCYNNKGVVYEQLLQYDKALEYYGKALSYYQIKGQEDNMAMSYSNMGIVHKAKKDYKTAIEYNKRGLELLQKSGDKFLIAATLTNIGSVYDESGDYRMAIDYSKQGVAVAKEIDAREVLISAYETIANSSSKMGDFPTAYQYLKLTAAVKDSFINTESTRQLSEMQVKFETAQKEKDLAESNAENARAATAIQRKNGLLIGSVLGLIGLAALAALIFRNSKLKQHKLQQAATLERITAQHKMQEEKLRISRELHDNIGSQLTFINSSLEHIQHQPNNDEVISETRSMTLNTIRELRSMVWLINKQEFSVDELGVKLREYVKPFQSATRMITVNVLGDGTQKLDGLPATNLFRIIQEGVNNAIKYAAASSIIINITSSGNAISLAITDNGIGFNTEDSFASFGLQNMKARAQSLNGHCTITSSPGQGTSVQVLAHLA